MTSIVSSRTDAEEGTRRRDGNIDLGGEQKRHRLARAVLAVDGAGCAAAAVTIAGSERFAGSFDPSLRSRRPVAVALGATSALLIASAVRDRPTNRDLERAALVNTGWVGACLAGLAAPPPRAGVLILAATAVLDGAAAAVQLSLRSKLPAPSRPWRSRASSPPSTCDCSPG